jgi:uncharacterized protein
MEINKEEIVAMTVEHGGDWGINHVRRVMTLIEMIGEGIEYDKDVIWVATHLHDWGAYKHWAQEGVDHAERSGQVTEQFLTEREYPEDFKTRVLECITCHHKCDVSNSIEAQLLFDADALDFFGPVGVLRIFSKSFKNLDSALKKSKMKRETLPPQLLLEKTRELAAPRLAEMDALLASFERDTFGHF